VRATEGESLDVSEEDGPASEVESLEASAEAGIGVAASSLAVVWTSAALSSEIGAVHAGGLDARADKEG